MANIELVIRIDENMYNRYMNYTENYVDAVYFGTEERILRATRKGTPLPKGHGRIGDLDRLIQTMKERNDDNGGEPLNAVDRGYDLAYQHLVKEAEECVIIGADTESEDKNG